LENPEFQEYFLTLLEFIVDGKTKNLRNLLKNGIE
jgi:hypothetical protein